MYLWSVGICIPEYHEGKTPTDSHENINTHEVSFCLNIFKFQKCHHVAEWKETVLEGNNTEWRTVVLRIENIGNRRFSVPQLINKFFSWRNTPTGPGPPHYPGFTITLRHTPHSVGLLLARDRPDAETSTWQHTTLTRDRHPCHRRHSTRKPSKRTATDPHLKPRGHWDQPINMLPVIALLGDLKKLQEMRNEFRYLCIPKSVALYTPSIVLHTSIYFSNIYI
jgi:hypothetical protein